MNSEPLATIVCLPLDLKELAIGFLFSIGIIDHIDGIKNIEINEMENRIDIDLTNKIKSTLDNFNLNPVSRVIDTSCGISSPWREIIKKSLNDAKESAKLNDKINGNPGYWVSRVEASNHFPGTAFVSYSGFRRDDFRAFLYKTTDYGDTWQSIVNNLPDESINVIREDHKNPNLLIVGTDMAVYVSIDCGKKWTKMKNNMPTQPVHDMVIHSRENDLVVATHGRGIFITDISPLQEITKEVLDHDVYLFEIELLAQFILPEQSSSPGRLAPQVCVGSEKPPSASEIPKEKSEIGSTGSLEVGFVLGLFFPF